MLEQVWKTFDALWTRLYAHGRRIEDLETRVTALERRLRERDAEAEAFGERPVLRIAEPEQAACDRCEKFHSPELPCPEETPVDTAWRDFADVERTRT